LEPGGADDTDTTRKDFPKPFSPTSSDRYDRDDDDVEGDELYEEFDRPTSMAVNNHHQKFRGKDFAVKDKMKNNRVGKMEEKRETLPFDDEDEFEKARRQGKVLRFVHSIFRSLFDYFLSTLSFFLS
jgi:hypothetical protein